MESHYRPVFEFLWEAGYKAEAKSRTCVTAAVLAYRFFRKCKTNLCPYSVAAACLYLAGKVEEDFIKIRDVVNVTYRMLHPKDEPLEVGELYWNLREGLGKLELIVLRTLRFQLHYEHPHKYLMFYLRAVKLWIPNQWSNKIAETAWIVLNDSYICPHVVVGREDKTPQLVALAVLYIALRIYGIVLPTLDLDEQDEHEQKEKANFSSLASSADNRWWLVFYEDASTSDLFGLAEQILSAVYDSQPPPCHVQSN